MCRKACACTLMPTRRCARSIINVRQQWCYDGSNGRRFKTLKTGSKAWRTIDLGDGTIFLLRRTLRDQDVEREQWGDGYADHDLVFCHSNGQPFDPRSESKTFERLAHACKEAQGEPR
jgi:hypothetical protein